MARHQDLRKLTYVLVFTVKPHEALSGKHSGCHLQKKSKYEELLGRQRYRTSVVVVVVVVVVAVVVSWWWCGCCGCFRRNLTVAQCVSTPHDDGLNVPRRSSKRCHILRQKLPATPAPRALDDEELWSSRAPSPAGTPGQKKKDEKQKRQNYSFPHDLWHQATICVMNAFTWS